jgi:hypothetical protein
MYKRLVLILAAAIVTIGILMLTQVHKRPTRGPRDRNAKIAAKFAAMGVKPGINPEQLEDARMLLVRERQMWSTFQGMSAHAQIDHENQLGRRVSFGGRVSLRQEAATAGSAEALPQRFKMTLYGDRGDWKVTTDGTSKGTQIACENRDLADILIRIDVPSVFRLLMFPRDFLLGLYQDELSPESTLTLDELVENHVWLPFDKESGPHSYVFRCCDGSVNDPSFEFKNGHFYRWRIGGVWGTAQGRPRYADATAFYFEAPYTMNSFWHPTVFRIQPMPEPWPYPGASSSLLVVTNISFGTSPCTNKGMLCVRLNGISVITH